MCGVHLTRTMFWIIFLTFSICVQAYINLNVKTTYGPIKGVIEKTQSGNEILSFYSIPFAAPPVGSLRLKPPVEPKHWTRLRNVTEWPTSCLQTNNQGEVYGSEDCLYLNVFTPRKRSNIKNKLPVMVYIHGGAYKMGGSSLFPPGYLLEKQIVLVTFNYRLGALGFLGFGTNEISGNFGLKDQIFALKWVQQNINKFGGNAKKVTIFGQSSGAASVHLHTFSSLSKGLFHRAIMQSGTALSTWSIFKTSDAAAMATAFGVVTGCYRQNQKEMLSCFQKLKPEEFLRADTKLTVFEPEPFPLFRPMIEGEKVKSAVLLREPTSKNYQSKDIPWIMGVNTGEGGFIVQKYKKEEGKLLNELNKDYQRLFPIFMHYQYTAESNKLEIISDKIKKYYFSNKTIGIETDVEFVRMTTDILFINPAHQSLRQYSGLKYFYVYDHKIDCTSSTDQGSFKEEYGINHSDELALLFPSSSLPFDKMTSTDKLISKKLVEFWTNFASHGDPKGRALKKLWEPVVSEAAEYLHIKSGKLGMEKNYRAEQFEFWKNITS